MIKRIFDFTMSFLGILILSPVFLLFSFLIKITSKGPVFFLQNRVGLNGKVFKIIKFRSMRHEPLKKSSLITQGSDDMRITRLGKFLRKTKIDELPQLFNVLSGKMSLVGPRPEVEKYVKLYDRVQKKVLSVKPGITDLASLEFRNEEELLKGVQNTEKYYIENIMPKKLTLNLEYISRRSFFFDLKIILKTVLKII
ncbi:MAG: sugar transferase [Spirochaetia bacterium]|nr:sugar transferase [Spirochaetia bacterium]